MVTEPLANILIEETEKLFPLPGQLPLDPEHVQLTVVFLEVEKLTEAPLNLCRESPFKVILPLYAPAVVASGGETRLIDCETCRQTRAVVGLGVAVWGTWVLVGTSVSVGVSVDVRLGVRVNVGVKEGSTKAVALGTGVCEATFSTTFAPPTGVQVAGMATGVGVSDGKMIAAGRVGGGNGLKAEAGLAKMETIRMPTIHTPIRIRMDNASQTENDVTFV